MNPLTKEQMEKKTRMENITIFILIDMVITTTIKNEETVVLVTQQKGNMIELCEKERESQVINSRLFSENLKRTLTGQRKLS